jgi:hypothetical protein
MVVGPVLGEPLSASNSLLTGKNTGNLQNFRPLNQGRIAPQRIDLVVVTRWDDWFKYRLE